MRGAEFCMPCGSFNCEAGAFCGPVVVFLDLERSIVEVVSNSCGGSFLFDFLDTVDEEADNYLSMVSEIENYKCE